VIGGRREYSEPAFAAQQEYGRLIVGEETRRLAGATDIRVRELGQADVYGPRRWNCITMLGRAETTPTSPTGGIYDRACGLSQPRFRDRAERFFSRSWMEYARQPPHQCRNDATLSRYRRRRKLGSTNEMKARRSTKTATITVLSDKLYGNSKDGYT